MDTRRSVLLSSTKLRSSSECVSSDITDKQSPSGPKLRPKQECLPHTTHRELQAKMEAENRQWRKTIKPLLDTENALLKVSQKDSLASVTCLIFVFIEELETFLSQRDTTQLRRKELLHKHWTERVWFPLQSRVEDGCKYTIRHIKKLPQSDRPFTESVVPWAKTPLQVSFSYPASASRKTPVEDETEGRELSRLDTIPYHVKAAATTDGLCHRPTCWFSRCGCPQ
ncbi:hypothetical protein EXN66_Car018450 [Channa argus]|uniref:Protein FAM228B n=1 Tax=Channa argus TaxID=215402 RepID=A0A6G1QJN8_CHAAH|nr:hypothetical protein EXN66_Car018450 [Channa argus]